MDDIAGDEKRILYVEDDEGLAYLLQKKLRRFGYEVDIATNGTDAISLYEDGKYHAILLDYTLPETTGVEVLKKIHPVDGDPPVIMLTAGGNEEWAVEALEHGAEDYIIKDVSARYLDLLPHVINAAIKKLFLRRQNRIQQESLKYYVSELENQNEKLHQEIVERMALEEELREAKNRAEEASQTKSEFLANMSHEIRTPMNAVVGLANILSASQPLTQQQLKYTKTLQTSAQALLALINDLLDISKIESRSLELESIPFSLKEILEDTIAMMEPRAREKKLIIKSNIETHDQFHLGDPTRIRQVLINLLSNAVKFTEAGHITVTASCLERQESQDVIRMQFIDTGIGIEPDKIGAIFEKFVQADSSINRKYGGTGLGLAICRSLIEHMQGTIEVDSRVNEGSIFTITFPLSRAKPNNEQKIQDGSMSPQPRIDTKKVLLVEDYQPNVLVAGTFLEQFGYQYDVAANGQEALDRLEKTKYGLVLMDVQMPVMNGLETTSIIRAQEAEKNTPHLDIIGMTANALSGDREKCIAAGMDDYITKPFIPSELEEKLRRFYKK